jgi:ABC-type lipoprotein export system ATPase subunit
MPAMVKLKRLKIQKFRNVAPGTELHFRDSLNVLLGKNGTGKTTLLNLIVSLLRWDFSSLLKEPVELEYDVESNAGRLTVRLRSEPRSSVLRRPPEGMAVPRELLAGTRFPSGRDYDAVGEIVASGGELDTDYTVAINGSTVVLRTAREELGSYSLNRPVFDDDVIENLSLALNDIARQQGEFTTPFTKAFLTAAFFSNTHTLRRFDESLEYLRQVTEDEEAFEALGITSESSTSYLVLPRHGGPGEIWAELSTQLQRTPEVDEIRVQTEDNGARFLEKPIRLLGFESAKVRIQRTSRRTEPHERIAFGNMRFDLARRDRSVINHHLLSYGQKRLLAFYYYLACSPSLVVADELVNGMHHEWIEACMDDLEGRQAFLTSQNPLLLDYLHFESVEEVLSSFVLCRTEPQGERDQLHWENLTREDAEGFFAAYQVGIQHVSEILRTRGLW